MVKAALNIAVFHKAIRLSNAARQVCSREACAIILWLYDRKHARYACLPPSPPPSLYRSHSPSSYQLAMSNHMISLLLLTPAKAARIAEMRRAQASRACPEPAAWLTARRVGAGADDGGDCEPHVDRRGAHVPGPAPGGIYETDLTRTSRLT
jgi:hypothetical protein